MTKRALLLVAALLVGCNQQSTSPAVSEDEFNLPADQVFLGMTHRMLRDGVVAAVLTADTAFAFEQSRHLDLMGVAVDFRNETGANAGNLTSATAFYDIGSRLFVARGDVVLITQGPEGPRRLETIELYYDLDADQLWSDHTFTLTEAGRTSRGTSFRTDSQFSHWEITGIQTQGRVSTDGGVTF
jgi:LPS export ABC transporter protein LptC